MSELVTSLNSYTPDALIGGTEIPLLTKVGTLVRGSGTVARGTVLGKITIGAATAAVNGPGEAGANTGNGTLTMDATTPILAGAKAGIYTAKVVRAALAQVGTTPAVPAQKAIVEFKDPDGKLLEVIDLATTPGNTVANQLKFAILEGTTPFAAGDGFKITVAAGSGYLKPVNSANVDGSAVAECINAQTVVVAAGAESKAEVYTQGMFNGDKLVFGGADTAATHVDRLRELNIFLTNEQ